jgi:hypothetical protein
VKEPRIPLLVTKPRKKVSEMTDEELRAFADQLFDTLADRHATAQRLTAEPPDPTA